MNFFYLGFNGYFYLLRKKNKLLRMSDDYQKEFNVKHNNYLIISTHYYNISISSKYLIITFNVI